MRKIITFLGRHTREAAYEFEGKIYKGRVFAEALREFTEYDQMLVCLTEEARKDSWPVLEGLNDSRILPISIPQGENTTDMWAIFDAILPHIESKDILIFDITHGLRSIPFLIFLFAAYLKTARDVKIDAIYYGALDLRDEKIGKPAPVIDLSPFERMLDWLTATDQFVQIGSANRLAELMCSNGNMREAADKASGTLTDVSRAALLCQPFTLMKRVNLLEESLQNAEQELAQAAHPFRVLKDSILEAYGPFGVDNMNDPCAKIRAEYRMVEWYFEKDQLIQAMTLAREWLVDAVTYRLNEPLNFKISSRNVMEEAVSGLCRIGRIGKNRETGEEYQFSRDHLNEYGRKIYDDEWPEKE